MTFLLKYFILSINLDVAYLLRKLIFISPLIKVLEKSSTHPGRYNVHNISCNGNIVYKNIALNEPFENIGMYGTQQNVFSHNFLIF